MIILSGCTDLELGFSRYRKLKARVKGWKVRSRLVMKRSDVTEWSRTVWRGQGITKV